MRRSAMVLLLVVACGARAGGPRAIAWDREACAHCHMLIGDPRHAAQLETAAGEVASFDDPGCLFAYLGARRPEVKALWFHHQTEERWLRGDAVGFVPAQTPMAYGLGAVAGGTPGAIDLAAAEARLQARRTP